MRHRWPTRIATGRRSPPLPPRRPPPIARAWICCLRHGPVLRKRSSGRLRPIRVSRWRILRAGASTPSISRAMWRGRKRRWRASLCRATAMNARRVTSRRWRLGLFAFSGMADHDQARVDLCGRYANHYGDDWWYLFNHGWALTENNDIKRGRAMTERAFAMREANANAVHALLHAMFEDGSVDDADALVDRWIPTYDRSGILHGHIRWHQALG